jgi:hypothetical protein
MRKLRKLSRARLFGRRNFTAWILPAASWTGGGSLAAKSITAASTTVNFRLASVVGENYGDQFPGGGSLRTAALGGVEEGRRNVVSGVDFADADLTKQHIKLPLSIGA